MKWSSCLFVALSFLLPANAAQDDLAKKDLDSLQGEWKAVAVAVDGKNLPEDQVKGANLTFKGDKVTTVDQGKTTHEATIKLDPSKKPKEINVVPLNGPDKGKVQPGIYSIEGNRLIICGAKDADSGRPTELKAGRDVTYILLERVKK